MKKRSKEDYFWQMKFAGIRCLKKFLFIFSLLVVVTQAYAQQKKVNISLKNVSLEKVFQEVRWQSDYRFVYGSEEIKKVILPVVEVENASINEVMDYCLKGTNFIYLLENNVVIVRKREAQVQQQKSIRVKGFVRDAKKIPLPGVTVKVVGLSIGTATNEKGWFAIELPVTKGALEFSFIGFKKKTVEFSNQTAKDTLQITLEEDIQALDETVVVAYGTTNKREMTGAVSVVKAEDLKGIPATDIVTLLQGRVAGMDITQMSGAPGGGGTAITIRGYNSLDVEQGRRFSDPLWVVDGVPLNSFASPITGTNLLADINPDMIESIQILKDASSASIYGSRAANGVIIVTTKKGRNNQKATFSANVSQTWSIVPEFPTVMIGKGERDFRWKALAGYQTAYLDKEMKRYKYPLSNEDVFWNGNRNTFYDYFFSSEAQYTNDVIPTLQDSLNSFYNNATNFFPVYFRRGKVTNANLQTYGGGERMSYGIGLGYYNEAGVFVGTGFNRIDLNSNLNVIPADRLNVDLRFNASLMSRKRGEKTEDFGAAPMVEKVPGDPFWLSTLYPGEGSDTWNATLDKLRGTKEKNRSIRLRSNFKIGYDIIDGLNISTSLAADYSIHRRNYFQPSYLNAKGYSKSLGETGINLMALSESLVSYQKIFREEHNINFLAGFSYQYDQMEYNGGFAQNSPSDKIYYAPDGMPVLGQEVTDYSSTPVAFQRYLSDMQEKSLISYFGRLEYNYKKKYLFSLSFRRDGSSVFGRHKKWGTFPAVAGGWSFSEEKYIKENLGWLSFGKFRASWGRSGKHFEEPYLALGLMNIGEYPHLGNATLEPIWGDGYYNEDLSWEETDQYDFGLDLDLFDYRLGLTLDYYYRYTDKLLYPVKLAGDYNGFYKQWRNAAAISNEGIELLVKYEFFRNSELYWKVSVNAAKNWNRIEKSYNKKDLNFGITGKPLNRILGFKTMGYVNKQEDLPLVYKLTGESNYLAPGGGIYSHQGDNFYRPGDYRILDVDGDGWISESDQVYLGSALPLISGGCVSEFRWKNFDLNLSMHFSLGRHIVNNMWMNSLIFNPNLLSSYNTHPVLMNLDKISFWQKAGDYDADYPRLQTEGKYIYQTSFGTEEAMVVDRQIEKVNYLKLKTLTLGYNLPQVVTLRLGLGEIRFFVSGENLFTWTNYSGIDPEVVDIRTGIDDGTSYPLARKYTLGLTVKF